MAGIIENGEPVKRKRGRPPKHNKLQESFPTLTLQFHTSPDSYSPTAELNLNLMVKMGEPDTFTPLMKVSPTVHRKKRRKSSALSVLDDSPTKRRENDMLTPLLTTLHLSRQSFQVNAAAIENMSYITGLALKMHGLAYHTPPHLLVKLTFLAGGFEKVEKKERGDRAERAIRDRSKSAGGAQSGLDAAQTEIAQGIDFFPSSAGGHNTHSAGSGTSTGYSAPVSASSTSDSASSRVLPSVENGISHAVSVHAENTRKRTQKATLGSLQGANLVSFVDDGHFSFELVVDDLGRAVLSLKTETSKSSPNSLHLVDIEPLETVAPPKLTHSHTAIGIETVHAQLGHRRIPSDPLKMMGNSLDPEAAEKFIVPQTPKGRDDFYVGYTPKYDVVDNTLAYNLTPQFNSMMYLMMSINSPQQKKAQLLFMPQDALGNIQYARAGNGFELSIDTELLGPGGRTVSSGGSSPDEGDARAALKKVFRMKKEA